MAEMSAPERGSLCGGMDATRFLVPAEATGGGLEATVAVGRAVAFYRVSDDRAGHALSAGWPSFVEYELEGFGTAGARALRLSGLAPGDLVEVWWRGRAERWSETRSVRLRLRADPDRPAAAWVLALDRLPHWTRTEVRRLRVLFHDPGPVALGAPRLIR